MKASCFQCISQYYKNFGGKSMKKVSEVKGVICQIKRVQFNLYNYLCEMPDGGIRIGFIEPGNILLDPQKAIYLGFLRTQEFSRP